MTGHVPVLSRVLSRSLSHSRPPRLRPVRTALVLVVVLLTAACGSVVKAPVGVNPDVGVGPSPAAPAAAGATSVGGSTAGAGSTASVGGPIAGSPATSGSSSSPSASAPSPTVTPLVPGGVPLANGPGVTATEIHIGVPVVSDTGSIYKSLGSGSGAPSADKIEAETRAIVAYINAHGGAAGRKLVADFYLYGEGSGTFTSQGQTICEHFTKDDKVLMVVAGGNNTLTLANCLAAGGVMMIDVGNSEIGDNQVLNALAPYYYRPFNANLDVFGTVIDAMVADGVLKPGDRVGDIRFNLPQYDRAMANVIKPALARHNISLVDDYEYSYIDSVAALGTSSAQTNNAILKFRTDNIDHVLLIGTQGVVPFFFMPAAESQGYHPTYVGSSMDIPGFMVVNVPADQMAKFYGLGWNRVYDLDWNGVFSHADVPQWNQCIKVMGSAGSAVRAFDCDVYMFIAAALNHVSSVSATGFSDGVARLGSSLTTGQTLSLDFHPGQTDGISSGREFSYSAACKCEVYGGTPVGLQ
jgi:ABC-type branched-subunit amino acid transport system substrate-binding protein